MIEDQPAQEKTSKEFWRNPGKKYLKICTQKKDKIQQTVVQQQLTQQYPQIVQLQKPTSEETARITWSHQIMTPPSTTPLLDETKYSNNCSTTPSASTTIDAIDITTKVYKKKIATKTNQKISKMI